MTSSGAPHADLPVVAFATDWTAAATTEHHVLRELAKSRRVLWLNARVPAGPRSLSLSGLKPVNVENDLWVATPALAPANATRGLARGVLELGIRMLRRQLGITKFQLWTFVPTIADLVGRLDEQFSLYYCVDEWSMITERTLLRRVDAVVAVNHPLGDAKRELNKATYVSPHGVDHALFAQALDDATRIPSSISALPRPRIGFHGLLRGGVDLELITHVARSRPEWSIVLLGGADQSVPETSAIRSLANVHMLRVDRHEQLPAYCKGLDVGMLPYRVEPRTAFVNPLELREYLSAGLPVVATPIPEVMRYANMCRIADSRGDFVAAIELALQESGPAARGVRSVAMKNETWSARVTEVLRTVHEIAQRKCR